MHSARGRSRLAGRRARAAAPRRRIVAVVTAMAMAASGGCAASVTEPTRGPSAGEPAPDRQATPEIRPGRLLVLPQPRETTFQRSDPDGTQRLIVRGFRLLEHADGSIESAARMIPGTPVQALDLPDRLGGGFLFWTMASNETIVYRAEEWVGEVEPFARLDFSTESFVAGFDRLYVILRESAEVVALDPRTGRVTDFGPLPASPTFRRLLFADAWFGVVAAPLRGALASFDAGASWHPLEQGTVYSMSPHADGNAILLSTERGAYVLDASGRMREPAADPSAGSFAGGALGEALALAGPADPPPPPRPPRRPLGDSPLRTAVLRGWPDSDSSAVVAVNGTLGRVRLTDGKPLELREQAFPESGSCQAIALGNSFGFVCGEMRGKTRVYAFRRPFALEPVLAFDQPRFVASSGNGALVIRGSCAADAPPEPRARAYCVRSRAGDLQEIRVTGDLGAERVIALRRGGAAVLIPPRLGAPGQLSVVAPSGKVDTRPLVLPKRPLLARAILRKGLWMEGFTELEGGAVGGWVAGANQLLGVRVMPDGTLRAGKPQDELERSLTSGRRALLMGQSGVLRETTNYGFEWTDVELPPALDLAAESAARSARGCSPVGCASADWVRIGWGSAQKSGQSLTAPIPEPTVFPPSHGGRWLVRCAPTGHVFTPPAPLTVAPPTRRRPFGFASSPVLRAEDIDNSPWSAFLGVPPPARRADDVGLDHETDNADRHIHAYAWGPRAGDWTRSGNFLVRATDPFELEHPVWSTATTRSRWSDVVAAAQAFGHNVYGTPSPTFAVALEPEAHRGLLFVSAMNSGPELYALEEQRPIVRVQDAPAVGIGSAAGVAKVAGTFYFGADGEPFRVMKLEGDRAKTLGSYPKLLEGPAQGALQTTLVRSARADALALWVRAVRLRGSSTSWYVYPIDPETGSIGEPLFVPPSRLADLPPSCGPDEDGWLLEGPPPVSPHLEFVGAEPERPPRDLRARMLVNEGGVCVLSLSAEVDTPFVRGSHAAGQAGASERPVPLTVLDRNRNGQRSGFRCSR